jgi:sporulation protein YlmC with PRC-barrel domain
MKLNGEIAQSTMPDAAKAEFMKALSEAQAADYARCAEVVARVQLAAGTTPDEPSGEVGQGYASPPATTEGHASGAATSAAADKPVAADNNTGYEKGHASADAALITHPGATANDSSTAGVSASGEIEQGYASPRATMTGDHGAADKLGATHGLSSMSVSDLIDKPVQNAAGEKLGRIDAIVTDKTGRPQGYAVIGSGGVLGVGEKQVLVHLDQLQVAEDGTIQLPTSDKKDVDAYPQYVKENYEAYDGAIARVL